MSRHSYNNYPPLHMQSRADYGGDRRRSDHFEPPRGPPEYDDRDMRPFQPPARQWGRLEYDERILYPDERDHNWDDDRMWDRPPPGPPLDPWRPAPEPWGDRQDNGMYWDHRPPVSPASHRSAPYDYRDYPRDPDGYREHESSWGVPPPPVPPGDPRNDIYRGGWPDDLHMRPPGDYGRDYPPPPPPAMRSRGNFRGNSYNNTRGTRGQRGRLRAIDNYKPYKQQSSNFIPLSRPPPRAQRERDIRSRSVSRTRTRSRSRSRSHSDHGGSHPGHDDSQFRGRRLEPRHSHSRSRSHSRSPSRSHSRSSSHAAPSRSPSAKAAEVSRPASAQGSSIGSSRPSSPGLEHSPPGSVGVDAIFRHSPEATVASAENRSTQNGQREPSPVPGFAIPGLHSSSPVMSPVVSTSRAVASDRPTAAVPMSSSQITAAVQSTIPAAAVTSEATVRPDPTSSETVPNTPEIPSSSLPLAKPNDDAPPTTPPPQPSVFGSPRARPQDADSAQYLTIGREPYVPFLDEEYAPPSDENLFPSDDNAFWRAEWSSAPFLATLHDSVKRVHSLPPDAIRARVDAVLKTNRAVLDTGSTRHGTDDEESSEEDILASHKKLLPVFRGRVSEAQNLQQRKVEGLKAEYRQRHAKWLIHCAELDKLKSLPSEKGGPPDLPTHVGRNTRRNAQLGTLGDTVRTEFEMEQIMASLGNEDMTDPNQLYQRNVAHIPDMISLQTDFFEYQYDDTNGYVENPREFFDELKGNLDHWTEEEEEIFKQKFAEFPKQFGAIAAALPNKTAEECVVFYYVTKRTRIDFRKVLQTYGTRRRGRGGRKSVAGNKGGALLADIQKTRRKASPPPFIPSAQVPQTENTEAVVEGRRQSGRQRTTAPKARALQQEESEESSEEPTPPPRRKGGRPSNAARAAAAAAAAAGVAVASPAATPPADSRKKIARNKAKEIEDASKKKAVSSYWSVGEKSQFLDLVRRLGKNFNAIAELMPEKSVLQVGNYYKTHAEALALDAIAAKAPPPVLPPNTFIQNGLQYQIVPIPAVSSHPWIPDPLQGATYGPPST